MNSQFPTNHKTIFVLDHTPYFGIPSDNPIEFDVGKNRGPGSVPLPPICKSLWTCSVEAAVEYCRIVWDLFPDGKLAAVRRLEEKIRSLESKVNKLQNDVHHVKSELSAAKHELETLRNSVRYPSRY